jgi:hypothetical protein
MAQIDNTFTAFFLDTTTSPWTPLTGLSATFNLVNLDNNSVMVNDRPMIEVWGWFYKYVYNIFDPNVNYWWTADPNSASAFIISGVTQLPSGARGGSGIGWVSTEQIKSLEKSFETKLAQIWEKINIPSDFSEIKSHIEIANKEVIDTIKAVEIPELPKLDISPITEWIWVLKARFTNLAKFLKEEQKQEMEGKDRENEGKMSELQSKIDQMEEAFEEMEGMKGSELDEKQKLIEDMEKTAQEIMEELEKEKVVNKEATEKEIKDKLISSLSE